VLIQLSTHFSRISTLNWSYKSQSCRSSFYVQILPIESSPEEQVKNSNWEFMVLQTVKNFNTKSRHIRFLKVPFILKVLSYELTNWEPVVFKNDTHLKAFRGQNL
jgi:hypothetical protein